MTFSAGAPGAYYYWATAGGDTLEGRPYKEDSQLYGAFIVDPPGDGSCQIACSSLECGATASCRRNRLMFR